jgi:hypothetical protein
MITYGRRHRLWTRYALQHSWWWRGQDEKYLLLVNDGNEFG